jgi:hypothetical protein
MVGSTFVEDPELTSIVNSHVQALYDLLIEVRGQPYYATDHTETTEVDKEEYPLPTDFYQLSGAPVIYDGSNYYQMKTWEENERARLLGRNVGHSIEQMRYRILANNISLLPIPNSILTLTIRYIPTFQYLVDNGDTFDGINGWEKWVELNSGIEMMNKGQRDSAALQVQLAQVDARIRRLAPSRDAANPPRIVDTRRDWHPYWDFNDWDA